MTVQKPLAIAALIAMLAVFEGCGVDGSDDGPPGAESTDDGPLGKPRPSALLAPFAGSWVFDFDKTIQAQEARGAPKQDIERLRKQHEQNPELGKLHADMALAGSQALCAGVPSAEYDFFGMHQHDGKVCGKAWHHEDRHDPGDMSKCYVRMAMAEDRLLMEVKMSERSPDLNDPDLASNLGEKGNSPPVDIDSAAKCDADKPAVGAWTPWMIYVFTRRQ
jgi:hypothetical protein